MVCRQDLVQQSQHKAVPTLQSWLGENWQMLNLHLTLFVVACSFLLFYFPVAGHFSCFAFLHDQRENSDHGGFVAWSYCYIQPSVSVFLWDCSFTLFMSILDNVQCGMFVFFQFALWVTTRKDAHLSHLLCFTLTHIQKAQLKNRCQRFLRKIDVKDFCNCKHLNKKVLYTIGYTVYNIVQKCQKK